MNGLQGCSYDINNFNAFFKALDGSSINCFLTLNYLMILSGGA